uniref:Uncharacterized protein n=1 Tax=Amphimedon queenslandica TaxID=400682 RepID=A0A1X7U7H9_AMPQE
MKLSKKQKVEERSCYASDTRWCCQLDLIKAILLTYPAVVQTLENIVQSSDTACSIEAHGILHGIKSFQFISCLIVCKKISGITANLFQMLQSKSIDYASAAAVIETTIQSFADMRSDATQWECLWEEKLAFSNHLECEVEHYPVWVVNPRGPGELPKPL